MKNLSGFNFNKETSGVADIYIAPNWNPEYPHCIATNKHDQGWNQDRPTRKLCLDADSSNIIVYLKNVSSQS